jgi:hypothetical protein
VKIANFQIKIVLFIQKYFWKFVSVKEASLSTALNGIYRVTTVGKVPEENSGQLTKRPV